MTHEPATKTATTDRPLTQYSHPPVSLQVVFSQDPGTWVINK